MALRLLSKSFAKQLPVGARPMSSAPSSSKGVSAIIAQKLGNREILAHGINGTPVYVDRADFPMPAVRFLEDTPEVLALREKEKGDWKKLSIHEKKALYRASFCQTFEEFQAPTGEWKIMIGGALIALSLALWISVWMNLYVYDEIPITFDEAHQKAQLKRMLDMEVNPVDGLSSKWDYENKRWK